MKEWEVTALQTTFLDGCSEEDREPAPASAPTRVVSSMAPLVTMESVSAVGYDLLVSFLPGGKDERVISVTSRSHGGLVTEGPVPGFPLMRISFVDWRSETVALVHAYPVGSRKRTRLSWWEKLLGKKSRVILPHRFLVSQAR